MLGALLVVVIDTAELIRDLDPMEEIRAISAIQQLARAILADKKQLGRKVRRLFPQ